ncbi:MAG TPA: PKD domain-containing protein, partial [Ferruginibacter sp.]|nr:PKD domain-containing protein [Ferruginibacter sp.]
ASKASCDATRIMVKLNKRMKCSSLAANGSDFTVNPPLATVTSATGIGCASGFDMDSILLTFNQPLPIGNYNLVVNRGSDNNTILDICDNGIPENEQIAFTILSNLPVPFDSLQHDHCLTDSLLIILADSIQCTSIAANGSDFSITGPYPVTIANAAPAYCLNGFTRQIIVRLNTAMIQPGNFRLVLQAGSDGNTLLSKCDTASVAGSFIPFVIKPKPFVDFSVPVSLCLPDALARFINRSTISDGTENLFQYAWDFGDPASIPNNTSSLKDPLHRYTRVGPFDVSLQVTSNAGCVHDTLIRFNNIHPQPISNFGFSKSPLCIGDVVTMTDSTNSMDGFTVEWYWDLGDGSTRNIPSFTYTYSNTRTYPVTLYSMNNHGCFSDTMTKTITVFPYPVVDAGPDRTVLAGGQLSIVPTVSGNGLQYLWTPSTYLDNPASPAPRCIAPQNDIRYTLTVTGEGGCKASDDMLVKVLKAPRIPNTFTPNNDGINDRWLIQYLED